MMIKKLLFINFLFLSTLFGSDVGKVSMLKGEALLIRDGEALHVKMQMSIQTNDTITTGKKSKMQLAFNDKTVVTLGAKTNFSVKEYLFEEEHSKIKLDVKAGSFKVITGMIGKLAPKNFLLKTKTSLIGIRGTIFAGQIEENGDFIGCLKGSIVVSSMKTAQSVTLQQSQAVVVDKSGFINQTEELDKDSFVSLSHLKGRVFGSNSNGIEKKNSTKKEKSKKYLSQKGDTPQDKFAIHALQSDKKSREDINVPIIKKDSLQELVNKQTIVDYSGTLKGVAKGSHTTPNHTTELEANIKADIDLRVDFGGNEPLSTKIYNQKLELISSKVDGKQTDVHLPLHTNFTSTMKMEQNLDIKNSKITANSHKVTEGFTSNANLEGTFSKDATLLGGKIHESTKGSSSGVSIDRVIDADFNAKKSKK